MLSAQETEMSIKADSVLNWGWARVPQVAGREGQGTAEKPHPWLCQERPGVLGVASIPPLRDEMLYGVNAEPRG